MGIRFSETHRGVSIRACVGTAAGRCSSVLRIRRFKDRFQIRDESSAIIKIGGNAALSGEFLYRIFIDEFHEFGITQQRIKIESFE